MVSLGERKCRANFQYLWLWKLDVRLLEDSAFIVHVAETTQQLFSSSVTDSVYAFLLWDSFKRAVKNWVIEWPIVLFFCRKKEEHDLVRTLGTFHELETETPGMFCEDIAQFRSQLEGFDTEQYQGALVRSRARKFLSGERPTRSALDDERRHALSKEVVELNSDGVILGNHAGILEAFFKH